MTNNFHSSINFATSISEKSTEPNFEGNESAVVR